MSLTLLTSVIGRFNAVASFLSFSTLAVLAASSYVLVRIITRLRYNHDNDVHQLQGPASPHWLWGHEKEVFDRSCGDAYSEWMDKYGDVVTIQGALGYGDILVAGDPKVLYHILSKHPYEYQKSDLHRMSFYRIMGKGMVSAEGDEHKRMKTIIGPGFTAESVRRMENAVIDSTQTMITYLHEYVTTRQKNVSDKKTNEAVLINAMDWTGSVALDVIGRVAFGFDFKCGTTQVAQEIHHIWRQWVDGGLSEAGFIANVVLRAFPPLGSLPLKTLQVQGAIRTRIRELVRPLAEERIAHIQSQGGLSTDAATTEYDDLMGYMIRASVRDGQEISLDELLDHMNTFVQTGYETTAGVIAYTLHALARYPDTQEKLRAELEEFGRDPNYDDLLNPDTLPYLEAVTKEALRIFPAGPHTERFVGTWSPDEGWTNEHADDDHMGSRMATEDDVIPLSTPVITKDGRRIDSIRIKKGQLIHIPFISINTHVSTWGPDGHIFRPSRWLSSGKTLPKVSLAGWQNMASFGEGARICVGWRLGLFEFKAVLSALVKHFAFIDTGLDVKTKFMATMQPFVMGDKAEPYMKKGIFMPLKAIPLEHM